MAWFYKGKEWDESKFPKAGSAESALCDILWYNGYFENEDPEEHPYEEHEETFCTKLKNKLKECIDKNEYRLVAYDNSDWCKDLPEINNWGSELHCIWMIFIGMFGDWGASIRCGWIERKHFQDMIDFLDNCEASICGHGE